MKNILLSYLILNSFIGLACENCNIFLNLSPNDYRSSFGLFYRSSIWSANYTLTGINSLLKHSNHSSETDILGKNVSEKYNALELRGTYYIKPSMED